jgi:hypothetical protein
MKREIKIFKSFEEQELYYLMYFASLSPSQRLKALSDLQKANYKDFMKPSPKKITVQKHFDNGY